MTATSTLQTIPADLRAIPRWVVWKYEAKPGKPKPTKVLKRPAAPTRNASSTDPSTWATSDEAVAALDHPNVDGAGFVFTDDDDIMGVDLDDCRDPDTGILEPWAADVIDTFGSYTEVSPSRTGVHIICRGKLTHGGRKVGNREIYESGRYFTVTGDHVEGTPVEIVDAHDAVTEFEAALGPPPSTNGSKSSKTGTVTPGVVPRDKFDKLMRRSSKFAATWNRNRPDLADPSQSSLDLALATRAAIDDWTDAEIGALIHEHRRLGNADPAKATRADYLDRTISKARHTAAGIRRATRQPRSGLDDLLDGTDATIVDLVEVLTSYLHFDDDRFDVNTILLVLAVAATRNLDGDPLWALLVGASSSSKTESLRLVDDVAAETKDEITVAGLLGRTKGKAPKPCGILHRIGTTPALITISDFSTVIADSDRGGRDRLFAALRRVYDGAYQRDLGDLTGPLVWEGRVTMLAGVTDEIDRYSAHTGALGPRWIYWRLLEHNVANKRKMARKSVTATMVKEARGEAARIAAQLVHQADRVVDEIVLDDITIEMIEDAALFAAYGRATVPRSGYGAREIDGVPIVEDPPRIARQLALLARGLHALGVAEGHVHAMLAHVAVSTVPKARARVLAALVEAASDGEAIRVAEVARRCDLNRKVARFALEDLEAVGVTEQLGEPPDDGVETGSGPKPPWTLTDTMRVLVCAVVERAQELGRSVAPIHTSPPLNPNSACSEATDRPNSSCGEATDRPNSETGDGTSEPF